jgi:hypothetical protein
MKCAGMRRKSLSDTRTDLQTFDQSERALYIILYIL